MAGGTIVAVGKRRTGKSWVFRNLMYHMKDKIPAGIVISQTDELNQFWRQYIPAKYISLDTNQRYWTLSSKGRKRY